MALEPASILLEQPAVTDTMANDPSRDTETHVGAECVHCRTRLTAHDTVLVSHDARLATLEERVATVEERYSRLESKMDVIIASNERKEQRDQLIIQMLERKEGDNAKLTGLLEQVLDEQRRVAAILLRGSNVATIDDRMPR